MIELGLGTPGNKMPGTTSNPLLKTLEFYLVAMTTTANQCQHVEYPPLCSAFQASGLTYNMQGDIIAGPLSSIGINNGSLYVTKRKIT